MKAQLILIALVLSILIPQTLAFAQENEEDGTCLELWQNRIDDKEENTYLDRYLEKWVSRLEDYQTAGTKKTKWKMIGKMAGLTALGIATWPYAAVESTTLAIHKNQTASFISLLSSAEDLLRLDPSKRQILKDVENTEIAKLTAKISTKKDPNTIEKVLKVAKIVLYGNDSQEVCKPDIFNGKPSFKGRLLIKGYIKKKLKISDKSFKAIDDQVGSMLLNNKSIIEKDNDEDEESDDESLNRTPGKDIPEEDSIEISDPNGEALQA